MTHSRWWRISCLFFARSHDLERVKGKGPVLDIALLHDEHMLRSALQSQKWRPIGMS